VGRRAFAQSIERTLFLKTTTSKRSTTDGPLGNFLWFYTAIFDAIQCSVLYLGCMRQSRELWVQTEDLDLNLYIELREEFDRVQKELASFNNGYFLHGWAGCN